MKTVEILNKNIKNVLGSRVTSCNLSLGELTIVINPDSLTDLMKILRDNKLFSFDTLIDLCGMDYSTYESFDSSKMRFAVVTHLLSTSLNHRLRVKCFCSNKEIPKLMSIVSIWPSAQWYEREAFDLFGIVFIGNPDLRRILSDYGFVGHPFRKDFPISGNVEVRYDPSEKRVVYQPVSIEPREIVPRVIREKDYGREQ
tara:strand:- start:187 stop:783 length:597 start_codon:yes stop_codon:yes gene_type:complete